MLCVAHPEPLADRLYLETKLFLENHVFKLLEERVLVDSENKADTTSSGPTASADLLLARYHEVWKEYSEGSKYLNNIYQ